MEVSMDLVKTFFDVEHECAGSMARTGVLHLPHGDVRTPVFMPVGTKGTVKAVSKDELEEIGFEIILANTICIFAPVRIWLARLAVFMALQNGTEIF